MEEELGRIKMNDTTDIVVRLAEYKGVTRLDIRKYVSSPKYTGWSPQGISIPQDKAAELKEILGRMK